MFTQEQKIEIKNKYLSGCSTKQLCEEYNTYRKKITKILNSFDIPLRKGKIKQTVTTVCPTCNILFEAPPHVLRRNNNTFCSKDCYNIFHQCFWEQRCKCCGGIFTTTKKTNIYCSRECYKKDYNPVNFDKRSIKGKFKSSKSDKIINYDSSYELRRLWQYELDNTVVAFERCTDKISYLWENRIHYYHPDFKVIYNDRVVVEEIKGYIGQLEIAKFKSGREFYKDQNIEYKIVTINTLNKFDIIDPIILFGEKEDFVYSWADSIYTQLACAKVYSQLSNCIRNKVGCFLIEKTSFLQKDINNAFIYLSQGVNTGTCVSLESGKCGCRHAEDMAIQNFKQSVLYEKYQHAEKIAFVTLAPCSNCAQLLIDNNVKIVYYLESYRDTQGIKKLRSNGVECIGYKDYLKNYTYSHRKN